MKKTRPRGHNIIRRTPINAPPHAMPKKATTDNATSSREWEALVALANEVIASKGLTIRAAATEAGFADHIQFFKWLRSKKGASHEPRANSALLIAKWVAANQL